MATLQRLRGRWEEGGYVMQSLLSGSWRRDSKTPALAVSNVVRSLDQFSAEDDQTSPWRQRGAQAREYTALP